MRYFSIDELCSSYTALQKGIDNSPRTAAVICNLEALVDKVLDPLRSAYGKPIKITSGYRCSRLNKAVGGSATSHHTKGMAADIVGTPNTAEENARIFSLIVQAGLPFTQLIWEKGSDDGPAWIHVSHDPVNTKRQILRTRDGRNYYEVGSTGI